MLTLDDVPPGHWLIDVLTDDATTVSMKCSVRVATGSELAVELGMNKAQALEVARLLRESAEKLP